MSDSSADEVSLKPSKAVRAKALKALKGPKEQKVAKPPKPISPQPGDSGESEREDSSSDSSSSETEATPSRYGTVGRITARKQKRPTALVAAPRKKPIKATPFRRHGRHFGRTVFAFTNIHPLLIAGMTMDAGTHRRPDSARARKEYRVYRQLLDLVPNLEQLLNDPETDIDSISDQIQEGMNNARSDDTKGLKTAIVDWITEGQPNDPHLRRNAKAGRGYQSDTTGKLLCPVGVDWNDPIQKEALRNHELVVTGAQWPHCMYEDETCDSDDPWKGLLKNHLLVKAFKFIFLSPSSVDGDKSATRAGNARLHGMTSVTKASLAYVATQVRFALSSATVFSRTDEEMDSEAFYNSVIEFLEDPEEQEEASALLDWWNGTVFSAYSRDVRRVAPEKSALSMLRQRRMRLKANMTHAAALALATPVSTAS
ncbi:hypothetical protein BKA70DRAFT_1239012 [Coprinopsis sp. MPI-PUGE-AT-0042]|nr:hypothetical protein BKA70DRAFT_1239012 [Coprinopsis sp. MPI-PUGE-AT-0042]